ncbi:hypothetical protein HYH03_001655 [Edaphochlamys debaryana]|uniref:Suppressor of forked domain-containing protein n=1 Tax=Edaphochlamys debaryana TaxID=47281 RepID=A0A835YE38_9CHLO|nr:hypothetical protein HYH03_001655 [Edaphochlamys debaryana]|eukprot:KAG2500896.1 hypothetical protein HYH03_001655 [Edaphochlamys debaryana]
MDRDRDRDRERDRDRGRGGGRGGPPPAKELLDKVRSLRAKALKDSYDVAAWDAAWEELRGFKELTEEVRAVFEELVLAFPTKADVWCRYAELELAGGNLVALKAIFQRCLMAVPSLELWALYIKFIRRSNKGKGAEGSVEVRNALDFTLDVVGQDINSGPFWQDAIQHLQTAKLGTPEFAALFPQAVSGQEDQARMAAVRKLFQRAVTVPHQHLDGLWRDYQRFETDGPNKQFAKKVLDEWSPKYHAAKAVYRDRKRKWEGISYALWPLPPGKGGLVQSTQADLWKQYLVYERSNPQALDTAALTARVSLAYDQALICFLHFPEFWLDLADWHAAAGRPEAAAATLAKAQAAMPGCLMLRLLAADLHERTGKTEQAVAILEGLALNLEQQQAVARGTLREADLPGPLLPLSAEQGELVWSQYVQLMRRVEGEFHARKMFLRARKWQQSLPDREYGCWRLYADAAQLEWRCGRDAAAARNVFEKGLEDPRLFREPQYVMAYLELLCGLGDLDNARALLVRALADEANARSVALWQRYLAFEGMSGDLAAVQEVERQALAALRGEDGEALKAALPLIRRDYTLYRTPSDLRRLVGLPTEPAPAASTSAPAPAGFAGPPGASIRPPSAYLPPPAADKDAPAIKQLPAQLGLFINSLPPPQSIEGILPDVDEVLDSLMAMDLTAAAVLQVCLDVESGKTLGGPGPMDQGPPYYNEPYGRSDPGGPYGGPPYGYGQGSPGRPDYPPGPYDGGPPGPPYDGGPPPYDGPPDEYGKRRFDQYGYDPNEADDDNGGYGGGRDLYHQRLRRRMDQ